MIWYVAVFWAAVAIFCFNIAVQIYYGNQPMSRVERFKTQMARAELSDEFESLASGSRTLGFIEFMQVNLMLMVEYIDRSIKEFMLYILSIVAPFLYYILG